MAKATSKQKLSTELSASQQEAVSQAKEHIEAAAVVLSPLGPEFERVSWLLEDTLVYIDQACEKETSAPLAKSEKYLDELEKLVNVGE